MPNSAGTQKLVCTLVALLLTLGSTGVAFGQDASSQGYAKLPASTKKELASLMKAGAAAYDRGDFNKSLRYFKDAYDLYPHPNLLYRIALAHEKLGEDEAALRYYRKFIEEKPDTKKRGRIEATIKVLEKRLAEEASQIRIKTTPSVATVFINDEINGVAGTTPLELPISPGNYKIIIKKEGYKTIEQPIDVPKGQTLVLDYAMQPVAKPKDAGGGGRFPTGPVLLGGFGVVSGIASWLAYSEYSADNTQIEKWDALKQTGASRPDGYNSTYNSMQFYETAAWVGGALAIGSIAGAVVWWLGDDTYAMGPRPDDGTALAIRPAVGPTGASVKLQLRY